MQQQVFLSSPALESTTTNVTKSSPQHQLPLPVGSDVDTLNWSNYSVMDPPTVMQQMFVQNSSLPFDGCNFLPEDSPADTLQDSNESLNLLMDSLQAQKRLEQRNAQLTLQYRSQCELLHSVLKTVKQLRAENDSLRRQLQTILAARPPVQSVVVQQPTTSIPVPPIQQIAPQSQVQQIQQPQHQELAYVQASLSSPPISPPSFIQSCIQEQQQPHQSFNNDPSSTVDESFENYGQLPTKSVTAEDSQATATTQVYSSPIRTTDQQFKFSGLQRSRFHKTFWFEQNNNNEADLITPNSNSYASATSNHQSDASFQFVHHNPNEIQSWIDEYYVNKTRKKRKYTRRDQCGPY